MQCVYDGSSDPPAPAFRAGDLQTKVVAQESACVNACRDATPCIVDACGYPMPAVGFHGSTATAKNGEEEDGAEGE